MTGRQAYSNSLSEWIGNIQYFNTICGISPNWFLGMSLRVILTMCHGSLLCGYLFIEGKTLELGYCLIWPIEWTWSLLVYHSHTSHLHLHFNDALCWQFEGIADNKNGLHFIDPRWPSSIKHWNNAFNKTIGSWRWIPFPWGIFWYECEQKTDCYIPK